MLGGVASSGWRAATDVRPASRALAGATNGRERTASFERRRRQQSERKPMQRAFDPRDSSAR
ncbi:hypothetical protein K788_0004034 [Paraburkholderia caribensis MBA4]|uniref:Uncharacterized protein n=1 Tax=Paraburkholderia caribensis MBA4 TaxID=1323664 RepID=A0A0P0R551_9BURK|nr:hypothetical protein K788_0004034 [Paraburkholderia caribensis MBA4]